MPIREHLFFLVKHPDYHTRFLKDNNIINRQIIDNLFKAILTAFATYLNDLKKNGRHF